VNEQALPEDFSAHASIACSGGVPVCGDWEADLFWLAALSVGVTDGPVVTGFPRKQLTE